MLLIIILVCVLIGLAFLYIYLTYNFDYWIKRGVKGPKPTVLVGNFLDVFLFKRSFGGATRLAYEKYPNEKYVGLFNGKNPVFVPRDLEVTRQILIKDFNFFTDRGTGVSNDPMGHNLFSSKGDVWKILRQNLTPVFSSGKLRNMFYLIQQCGDNFQKYIGETVDKNEEIEIRDLTGRYTLEVICNCAFGIEVNGLKRGTNVFQYMGKKIFEPSWSQFALRVLDGLFPGILRLLDISIAKPGVVEFFDGLVKQIVEEREGKPKIRQDFMDLILTLREKGTLSGGKFKKDDEFALDVTDRVIAAQAFIFYAAGFETSSGTMAFMLYELAMNQDIQDKLRVEINKVTDEHKGFTYEALQEMRYLEMAFNETLRKYPVGEILSRECVMNYTLPGSKMTLDKGVKVIIPVMGFHRDPQYYPDPEKFDPERFSPEKKHSRIPYMPFGEGPRNCIALRFAKLQSMLGLAMLLQQFGVRPSPRTVPQLSFDPRAATLSSAGGIWLDIHRL